MLLHTPLQRCRWRTKCLLLRNRKIGGRPTIHAINLFGQRKVLSQRCEKKITEKNLIDNSMCRWRCLCVGVSVSVCANRLIFILFVCFGWFLRFFCSLVSHFVVSLALCNRNEFLCNWFRLWAPHNYLWWVNVLVHQPHCVCVWLAGWMAGWLAGCMCTWCTWVLDQNCDV